MVDTADRCVSRIGGVPCLCDVGRLPGKALPVRTISVTFLFAGIVWQSKRRMVWPKAELGAGLGYGGDAHPLGARRVSANLLLLSRRLLQSVLGGSSFLHGWRASEEISRRALLSFDPAKYPPLFSLCGAGVSDHPGARRLERVLVRRSVWRGPRHSRPVDEPRAAQLLHVQLPLASSSGRRFSRSSGRCPGAQAGL